MDNEPLKSFFMYFFKLHFKYYSRTHYTKLAYIYQTKKKLKIWRKIKILSKYFKCYEEIFKHFSNKTEFSTSVIIPIMFYANLVNIYK